MFTPVCCHFELYASNEGTADDYLALSEQAEPLFKAFSLCFGLELAFYNKINGEYLDDTEVDWSDSTTKAYRFQAVYDCKEMYRGKAKAILKAADEFCKYHGFHWHEKRVEPIINNPNSL